MSSKLVDRLLDLSINRRRWVYWGLLIITLAFVAQLPHIQIDTDPENMLLADNPARVFHNQAKQTFAMHDAIVVGVVNQQGIYNPQTLAALIAQTDYASQLDGVIPADMMSLANVDNISQGEPGTIRFEWMMKTPPADITQAKLIEENIRRLPMLLNTLVSEDGKAAALYVPIKDKNQSYAIAKALDSHIQTLDSQDEWHITGLPVAEDRFGYEMFVQMGISAPLAGLTIFVLLFVFFRNVPFIAAPMILAMATVLITMGLLIGMGFTVHIMSSMIAIFLMPIAVVDSVHILSEFADRYRQNGDAKAVIRQVMGHLFTPMLFTSITSTVGFLSLMLTPIPPVQIFGAFVGFGIMLAFALTVVFIPAYLSGLSPKTLEKFSSSLPDESKSWLTPALYRLGKLANSHARLWLLGFAGLFAVSVYGISLIQINDNPVRWFKADHELRIADKVLNSHFAGTYNAFLVLKDSNDWQAEVQQTLQDTAPRLSADSQAFLQTQHEALSQGQSLTELVLALDDYSFNAAGKDSEVLLELISTLETLQSQSKTFLSPEMLNYMVRLQDHLASTGLVGKSNSLADIVKTVNRELFSGKDEDFCLPGSSDAIAQTLLQYQSSHRPQDLWHFVTPDYRQSLIWLQLTSGDNQDMTAVMDKVADYLDANPLPPGLTMDWAGKAYLNVIWQKEMVAGMLNSLISAFVTVMLMMMLLFRSFWFGLLAMLPLTLTISFIYGLIGLVGKDYDMPIAVLSALTLGLSVDFAIHFIERLRATYAQYRDWHKTLEVMFEEPARAISRNAIVIAMGFTPLLFAPLVPYITVGVFLASIMAISALVTLLVLPSAMTLLKSRLFKTNAA
ncbi:MMPL family transporter [Aliiglaciecola sp. CAU 1673]|uniref:efflux RND transporter permease subunit n=1 Tax=Aliiglaciecola sp. CAU 1673 TaxID=3032595 RepID=UPI0023DAD0FF|nr:MMPL family transporter [Aliiglaciecola sp. CAU 1673]MDF2180087.1 MMPL family transporter [Aliiglaciecola sp. CAU 1673]